MHELGKALVVMGLVLVVLGALAMAAARFGLPLGRLPGDFAWKGKNFSIYVPLGTSIAISVALTVIMYLIARMRR
jgi:Protein of unknown function (DUF2905)